MFEKLVAIRDAATRWQSKALAKPRRERLDRLYTH